MKGVAGIVDGRQAGCGWRRAGRWLLLAACMPAAAPVGADPPHAVAASAARAGKPAVLVVKGGGKPVAQADVQLRAPGQPELNAHTDRDGVVSFVPKAPRYTVRVLARGWVTFEADFPLAAGTRTEIQLRAKPAP
jgi:hypothetical protein